MLEIWAMSIYTRTDRERVREMLFISYVDEPIGASLRWYGSIELSRTFLDVFDLHKRNNNGNIHGNIQFFHFPKDI
jgi:hypothetical protein